MLQLLQDQHRGPLAHDEAAALLVKGDGGTAGIGGVGQGAHGGESAHGQGRDGGLGSAGHHHLGVAVPDVAESVTHRIGAAGAGRHWADAHAVQSEADGDMAGRQVGDHHWDEEGGDPVKAPALPSLAGGLEGADAADAAGQGDADPSSVLPLQVQAAVGYGLRGRRHGKLGEAVHPPDLLLLQHAGGVELLHLAGQGHLLGGVVIEGDGGDTAHTRFGRLPGFPGGMGQGGDRVQGGDK